MSKITPSLLNTIPNIPLDSQVAAKTKALWSQETNVLEPKKNGYNYTQTGNSSIYVNTEKLTSEKPKETFVERLLRRASTSNISMDVQDIKLYHETKETYRFMLHPNSSFRKFWDICVAFAVIYVCLSTPLVLGFSFYSWERMTKMDNFFEGFFIIDLILTFRTGVYINGDVVMNPKRVAVYYLKQWIILDIVSLFPTELFFHNVHSKSLKLAKLTKIPKLLRFNRLLKYLREYAKYYNLALTCVTIVLILHIFTCIWVMLYHQCNTIEGLCDDKLSLIYVEALHIIVVTFFGNVDYSLYSPNSLIRNPENDNDIFSHVFNVLVIVVGVLCISFVYGNMMTVLTSWDQKDALFRNQMDLINAEMKYYNLPHELQRRVRKNYDYLWINQRAYDKMSLLRQTGISLPLKTSIALHLYQDLLAQVPLFRNTSNNLLGKVCLALKTNVYLPGDVIIFENDIGREMFIIRKGTVEVILPKSEENPTGQTKIMLSDGSFFGETALVMEVRRTNTVIAATVCDLNVLDKRDFDEILAEYPEFGEKMKNIVVERQIANMHIESATTKLKLESHLKRAVEKSMKNKTTIGTISRAKTIAEILHAVRKKKTQKRMENSLGNPYDPNKSMDSSSIPSSKSFETVENTVHQTSNINVGRDLGNSSDTEKIAEEENISESEMSSSGDEQQGHDDELLKELSVISREMKRLRASINYVHKCVYATGDEESGSGSGKCAKVENADVPKVEKDLNAVPRIDVLLNDEKNIPFSESDNRIRNNDMSAWHMNESGIGEDKNEKIDRRKASRGNENTYNEEKPVLPPII